MALPEAIQKPMERTWSEAEAYAYCAALTKSHYENFPVGSFLVPAHIQPAIHSLYAFMRTADDFSDEDRRAGDEEERLSYIQTWDQMLSDCEQGKATHPIFLALRSTLKQYDLPAVWLHDLLKAFSMDCTVRRYETFQQLVEYCRYSAIPVGRLILALFGYRDEERYALSDAICTGLQLANHWQDVAVDLKKDRIYLPQADLRKFMLTDEQLLSLDSRTASAGGSQDSTLVPGGGNERGGVRERFCRLMAFEVARAREFFERGRSLPDRVEGRLRWELRLTWHGGARTLEKIEQARYDVFAHRPIVTKADWLAIAFRALI